MTSVALLIAIVVLLGMTPLGLIPLGFINITILCIPVLAGTFLLGQKTGMLLGATFASVSFFRAMTQPSALVAPLVGSHILYVVLLCYVPRLLFPLVAGLVERLLLRTGQKRGLAYTVSSLVGSLVNTVFYLGMMLLFYIMSGLDTAPVIGLIVGTGVIAGSGEAAVAAILVPPLVLALEKAGAGQERKQ